MNKKLGGLLSNLGGLLTNTPLKKLRVKLFLFSDDLEFREGDCGLGDNVVFECNFDGKDPLCGFVNDAKQMLNFTRSSGRVSAGTGPDADHTVYK